MIGAKCKYKTNFYIDLILFFLNNQQMWVSEGFLCASSLIQLIKSSPSLNQDYMYIFDKTITKYTKEIMSVLWFVILGGTGDLFIVTISGKIITILDTAVITISLVNIIIIITQYFTYSKSLIN